MAQFNLDKIKRVPTEPGVYFFKNKNSDIIYIGKAKNLRNRVRSYYQNNKYQTPKNISMSKRIVDIEWLVVRNEVEALLTEANLIKQHQPYYNVNLKMINLFHLFELPMNLFQEYLLPVKSYVMDQNILALILMLFI